MDHKQILDFEHKDEHILNNVIHDVFLFLKDLFSVKYFKYNILNKNNFETFLITKDNFKENKYLMEEESYEKVIDFKNDVVCEIKNSYQIVLTKYNKRILKSNDYFIIKNYFKQNLCDNIEIYISNSNVSIMTEYFIYVIKEIS